MFYIEPTCPLGKQLSEIIAQEEQARLNAVREVIREELAIFEKRLIIDFGLDHKPQRGEGRILRLHKSDDE